MKQLITLLALAFCLNGWAQTNVSGGIFSNTTWSLSGSPYIITDTVVVFPGDTLTIEPGVVVKFNNNQRLEIRQACIIANGTATDSITFTSNSSSPAAGSWLEIFLNQEVFSKFNYCHFRYASTAISRSTDNNNHSLNLKNSTFDNNIAALYLTSANYSTSYIDSCILKNNTYAVQFLSKIIKMNYCSISHNQIGIDFAFSSVRNSIIDYNSTGININLSDTVENCAITNNAVGLQNLDNTSVCCNVVTCNNIENNNVGISLKINGDSIYNNQICNNTAYNLKYLMTFSSNTNVLNNFWCSTNSVTIASGIYDGHNNTNYGLANYIPFASAPCSTYTTKMETINISNLVFSIYPNPSNGSFIVEPTNPTKQTMQVYDVTGKMVLSQPISGKTNIDATILNEGVYNISLISNEGVVNKRLVIVR